MSDTYARYVCEADGDVFAIVDTTTGTSVGVAPDISEAGRNAQTLNALALANERRMDRSRLKTAVKGAGYIGGYALVADLISTPPASIGTMTVANLLCWVYRVRTYQAKRILGGLAVAGAKGHEIRISEHRTVASLTERERDGLAAYLRGDRVEARWAA